MTVNSNIIEFRNVTKRFGQVCANEALQFSVKKGSIHGIIGENGAGKSTAMKILFGLYKADSGDVLVNGITTCFTSPTHAMKSGIGMVHQHFMLADSLTALDNVLLHKGSHEPGYKILSRKEEKHKLEQLSNQYGFNIDWDAQVSDLPVGIQQRIEIIKILACNSDIIILDEPTAVLTPQEVKEFFVQLRKLQAEGKTILIITHKLKEILEITDSVTVFRAGKVVGNESTKNCTVESLATMMMGHSQSLNFNWNKSPNKTNQIQVSLPEHRLHIQAGEILGIAGVEGNGQDDLIQSFIESARKKGQHFGAFPEDRLKYGMLSGRPAFENFYLTHRKDSAYTSGIWIQIKKLKALALEQMKKYDVRPANPELDLDRFSGGNQQKFVVSRELYKDPTVVLAAQPTRGVDIGAIDFIHKELIAARDRGASVLLISSELDELLKLSDRIGVLYRNKIVAEFQRDQFSETSIGSAMGGQEVVSR